MPFPEAEKETQNIYARSGEGMEETFAEAFINLGGKFIFCDSEQEMIQNINMLHESRGWTQMLCAYDKVQKLLGKYNMDIATPLVQHIEDADACITGGETLVARTGSVMLSSKQYMGRTAPVYYPVHIIVAYADQIVNDIDDAFALMKKKYGNDLPSMINLNTGPSRTADIEKTLVVGVHGPAEVFCFLVNADSGQYYK